ncbi:MAG: hypothetical protein A2583_05495 [Bdellovibrionales bacterium RIFOXYD1_FULL_53_11]|nr:MAG: hypothetical protein A2583_05495 [Bdellovibrionales bacterium RIFOXYD1_FULL_53_11]
MAKDILEVGRQSENYFNWDDQDFQLMWLRNPNDIINRLKPGQDDSSWLVLDELHKFKNWKNTLKGLFDLYQDKARMMVTGSARLETYRKTGDSLAGRYRLYRLHPFSFNEKPEIPAPPDGKKWFERTMDKTFDLDSLLTLGGFPEPLLGGSKEKADRWWRLYKDQIVRDDLRDIKSFREINMISAAANLLAEKAGGTLSVQSIQEDLKVSFATANDWIEALCAVYFGFVIRPYAKSIKGALHKEPKFYLYNYAAVKNNGARLENLFACHLLKACNIWTDAAFGEFELKYIKDKYKREVDFVVLKNSKPWLLLEVKSSPHQPTDALLFYSQLMKPRFTVQVGQIMGQERTFHAENNEIELLSAEAFLSQL